MTDAEKLRIIDSMIAEAWEASPMPTATPDRCWGYYDAVLVCISSVINLEDNNG